MLLPSFTICKFSNTSGGNIRFHMVWHCKDDQLSYCSLRTLQFIALFTSAVLMPLAAGQWHFQVIQFFRVSVKVSSSYWDCALNYVYLYLVVKYDPSIFTFCLLSSSIDWLCVCFSLHLAPLASQTAEELQTATAEPAIPNLSKSFTLGKAGDMRVSKSCHTYACALCICGRPARTRVSLYNSSLVCIAGQIIFKFSITSHTHLYT